MSFAIIQTGGKQYKVKAGEIIKIERLEDSKPESKVEFKEILAYGDNKSIELGEPTISGAKVEADLLENGKNRMIFTYTNVFTRKYFCSSLSNNYISRHN